MNRTEEGWIQPLIAFVRIHPHGWHTVWHVLHFTTSSLSYSFLSQVKKKLQTWPLWLMCCHCCLVLFSTQRDPEMDGPCVCDDTGEDKTMLISSLKKKKQRSCFVQICTKTWSQNGAGVLYGLHMLLCFTLTWTKATGTKLRQYMKIYQSKLISLKYSDSDNFIEKYFILFLFDCNGCFCFFLFFATQAPFQEGEWGFNLCWIWGLDKH